MSAHGRAIKLVFKMLDSSWIGSFVEGLGLQDINSFLIGASLRAYYSQALRFIPGDILGAASSWPRPPHPGQRSNVVRLQS